MKKKKIIKQLIKKKIKNNFQMMTIKRQLKIFCNLNKTVENFNIKKNNIFKK